MILHTCSETISFAKQLEKKAADFYKRLSPKYAKDGELLLSLAKENEKNIVQIERSYYGVITDAIEGCFAFDINTDEYAFKTELAEKASFSDALSRAVEIEKKMTRFYSDAAEQSKTLMADVPRTFAMVAKKRNNRISKLRALLGNRG